MKHIEFTCIDGAKGVVASKNMELHSRIMDEVMYYQVYVWHREQLATYIITKDEFLIN